MIAMRREKPSLSQTTDTDAEASDEGRHNSLIDRVECTNGLKNTSIEYTSLTDAVNLAGRPILYTHATN